MRRHLSAAPGVAAALTSRPVAKLVASLAAFIVLYLLVIPTYLWPGLLPSGGNSYSGPSRQANNLIDELYTNFTRVYSEHDDSPPPEALYPGPWLSHAQEKRYEHLRNARPGGYAPKYMLTTITRNIASQLPDLLNTIAVLTYFLGPEHVSLSIIEGPSGDTTPHILNDVLRPLLERLGVPSSAVRIVTNAPKIDFNSVNRIEALAELRNEALKPLWEDVAEPGFRTVGVGVSAVVFFNDVYLRASDVLELLHQHVVAGEGTSGTGITTAWDWMTRDPAYFYDVWVGRTLDTGDLFYPIDGTEWQPSDKILHNSPASLAAFNKLQPFQVFSSWNALAVLNPQPFLPPYNVRFRRGRPGECAASECQLICSDFWKHRWGRVQIVPSVQLAYDKNTARQTSEMLSYAQRQLKWSHGVPPKTEDKTVSWTKEPPHKVRCHAWPEVHGLSANVWEHTTWVPPYTHV